MAKQALITSPTFSVIIPCFNRAEVVGRAIKSVLDQTFQDFEVIVVDDGSRDNLKAVVESEHQDPRVRYVYQDNKGGGAARNLGTRLAEGKFIAFLDSDDLFLPEKLQKFHTLFSDRDVRAAYSKTFVDRGLPRYYIKPSRGIKPGERMSHYLFAEGEVVQTSTIVLSRTVALDNQFDETLKKGQDLDLCLRLARAGIYFAFIDEPLSIWTDRSSTGRISHAKALNNLVEWGHRLRPHIPVADYLAFQACVLSYDQAADEPATTAKNIALAVARRAISVKRGAKVFLRAFLPQSYFRAISDAFIRIRSSQNRSLRRYEHL